MTPKDEEDNQMVNVPLPEYIEQIAKVAGRVAAQEVLLEHVKSCPNYRDFREWRVKVTAKVGIFVALLSAGISILGWVLTPAISHAWLRVFAK